MVGKWNWLLLTAGTGMALNPLYVDGKGVSNNDCGVWAKHEQTACIPGYVNRNVRALAGTLREAGVQPL